MTSANEQNIAGCGCLLLILASVIFTCVLFAAVAEKIVDLIL